MTTYDAVTKDHGEKFCVHSIKGRWQLKLMQHGISRRI